MRRGGFLFAAEAARNNPEIVSGNNGNRVREPPVSRGRIFAYVMPSS
jgi:hypothetical protein